MNYRLLRKAREEQGKTVRGVAKKLGVGESTIWRMEKGVHMKLETVEAYCKELELEIKIIYK